MRLGPCLGLLKESVLELLELVFDSHAGCCCSRFVALSICAALNGSLSQFMYGGGSAKGFCCENNTDDLLESGGTLGQGLGLISHRHRRTHSWCSCSTALADEPLLPRLCKISPCRFSTMFAPDDLAARVPRILGDAEVVPNTFGLLVAVEEIKLMN
jgi:hypothetical protein